MSTPLTELLMALARKYGFGSGTQEEVMTILKNTAFKSDPPCTNEQMVALLIVADQYGLNPFTKEIYAFPDKKNGIVPVVGIDGWSRIINSHPSFNGIEFEYSEKMIKLDGMKYEAPEWIECIIYRKDRDRPTRVREYLHEIYRAPFKVNKDGRSYELSGPWQTHTLRLSRHKVMIQGGRISFGFGGIYDEDEAQRLIESSSMKDITPKVEIIENFLTENKIEKILADIQLIESLEELHIMKVPTNNEFVRCKIDNTVFKNAWLKRKEELLELQKNNEVK